MTDALTPPPARTLAEQVYHRLKQQVLSGQIAPGERLVVQTIAKQLDVSLSPVRESLQRLAVDRLIEFHPHRGATAVTPTPEDFQELYLVRAQLERLAARLAHPNLSADQLDELDQTIAAGQRCLDQPDDAQQAWIAADERFHRVILEAAGNTLLRESIAGLRDRIRLHRQVYFQSSQRIKQSVAEHQAILNALRTGTPDDADRLMHTHLTHYLTL